MANAPAISPIPPTGSTRRLHAFIDWNQAQGQINLGPGNSPQYYLPLANFPSPSAIPVFGGWSGVNKNNGRMIGFLGATSFNIGMFGKYVVPIVGANPGDASTLPPPEESQYYCYNFWLSQGEGIAQPGIGFTPINPPYTGIASDIGVFFVQPDPSRSASSYHYFTDISGSGGEGGFGFYVDATGTWHYAIRYVTSSVITPLDVDVTLPAGQGAGKWPVPIVSGVPQYGQFVNLCVEFFAAGVNGPGSAARMIASLNGLTLVNTTFANAGASPVGSGLASQIPDFYSAINPLSTEGFGVVPLVRAGPGTGSPAQIFPLGFNQAEFIGGPALPTTFATK